MFLYISQGYIQSDFIETCLFECHVLAVAQEECTLYYDGCHVGHLLLLLFSVGEGFQMRSRFIILF